MLTNMPSCSTLRLDECWTYYTRLCEQVDIGVVNTITVACRMKLDMPNSYIVDSSVGTVGLAFHPSNKQAYLSACSAAHDSILKSRADHIKSELDEVSEDVGATWRTTQRLLHSKHKSVYDDAEFPKLVSTFCQFFNRNVNCICDNISDALASPARRVFAARPHQEQELSSFQPVTVDEVRRLVSSLGDRAFPVAGARAWNALPPSVITAPSLSSFRRILKTFLFQRQLRQ